jgi:hypothetical protein
MNSGIIRDGHVIFIFNPVPDIIETTFSFFKISTMLYHFYIYSYVYSSFRPPLSPTPASALLFADFVEEKT